MGVVILKSGISGKGLYGRSVDSAFKNISIFIKMFSKIKYIVKAINN